MARNLHEIIAQIRYVAANPAISTTLIQTEDLELLCKAAEGDGLKMREALEMIVGVHGEDSPSILWTWAQELARAALNQ